jgi:hypothetical protein
MSLAFEPAPARDGVVVPAPTRDLAQGLRNIADYGLTIVPDALVGDGLNPIRFS